MKMRGRSTHRPLICIGLQITRDEISDDIARNTINRTT